MSILMDALKQQQQSPPTVSDGSAFWRKLALLLALLLAASVGAATLQVQRRPRVALYGARMTNGTRVTLL